MQNLMALIIAESPDVLLSCLHRHAERRGSAAVDGHSDDSPGHASRVGLLGRHERRVGPTVPIAAKPTNHGITPRPIKNRNRHPTASHRIFRGASVRRAGQT